MSQTFEEILHQRLLERLGNTRVPCNEEGLARVRKAITDVLHGCSDVEIGRLTEYHRKTRQLPEIKVTRFVGMLEDAKVARREWEDAQCTANA